MITKIICASILLIVALGADEKGFENYSLFKILPHNEQHIKLLRELQDSDINYDFWTDPVPFAEYVNVMSSPQYKGALENFLNDNSIDFEITISDMQEVINKQTINRYTRRNVRSMTWDAYYNLEDTEAWMSDMAAAYPDIVSEIVGGVTYEGRQIKGLKITHGGEKRAIFVESGIHSREWIVVTFACYLINELLTSNDAETMAAARDFEWYIFPATNPDGYAWTHASPANRMWRKNRRPIPGSNSIGVDLNRNWNNNWLVAGSSINPATDTYAGPGPFSELETRSLSEFIRPLGDKIDLYLSFHSFSQLLLIPFGNSTERYANYDEAIMVGRRAMGALAVRYNTHYATGNIAEAIYRATGGSVDWVKEQLHIPLVYCYELRDNGTFGFLLPVEQILPNHEETMDSVIEMILQGKRFGLLSGGAGVKASLMIIACTVMAYLFVK